MITQNDIDNVLKEFQREENRAPFMTMAQKLLKEGNRDEAVLLILSTWNFASFRYIVTTFNVDNFRKVLSNTEENLKVFENVNFENINFKNNELKKEIIQTFNHLAYANITNKNDYELNSIGPTGAAKLLYLLKPEVFVMWDTYIRREEPLKYYEDLSNYYREIYDKKNNYPRYKKSGEGYYNFLGDMHKLFLERNLEKPKEVTWPKLIDEFNFVKISKEILKAKKNEREALKIF